MTDAVNSIALRRAVLAHWIAVPGCYLLLRLSRPTYPVGLDILLMVALTTLLWFTLLAYTRWVSPALVRRALVPVSLVLGLIAMVLAGGPQSDFYLLICGLILLLVASQCSSRWVLGLTFLLGAGSGSLLLWPGVDNTATVLGRIGALLVMGLVLWFYVRPRNRLLLQTAEAASQQRLTWLQQISERITSQTDPEKLREFAVLTARQMTGAQVGGLLILDEDDRSVGYLYSSIGNEPVRRSVLKLNYGSNGLCDQLIREGQAILDHGPSLDVGTPGLLVYYPPIYSFLGVPLQSGQQVFGALFAANRRNEHPFSHEDRLSLTFLATQVSMALENRRLVREVRMRFTSTIEALVTAIEAKHPYTRGHSEQVIRYAVATARELHLSEEEIENIRVAAVLHDIGKIGVPEGILNKAGALTERERAFIMSHPYIGAKIVEAMDPRGEILYVIYYHHENYDGSGYPKGLKGDQIPLGASIIRVADAFEAMTSERPYQRKRTALEALRELQAGAGRQFDPVVVRAFRRALERLAEDEARRG